MTTDGGSEAPGPEQATALDTAALEQVAPGAWLAQGEQMVVSVELIVGRWFSHRITEHELVAGWLDVRPDFAALPAFATSYTTADGLELRVVEPGADDRVPASTPGPVLLGPEGWLDHAVANARVCLSVDRDSALSLRWEPPGAVAAPLATPVEEVFLALGGGRAVSLVDLSLHLLVRAPELFDADAPPLADLLAAAGLAMSGAQVTRVDHTLGASGPSSVLPGLGPDSSRAAEQLLQAVLAPAGSAGEGALDHAVVEALEDGAAVAAVAEQIVGGGLMSPPDLEAWLDGVASRAEGAAGAGLAFLRSRLCEWTGDTAAEEAALESSRRAAELPAALVDSAWFAADRGDSNAALALLRSAGVPADDPEAQIMRSFTVRGRHSVGRNDACWCGSGRKHKHCCLRLNGHGLETRARWLHTKAVTFLQRPPQREAMLRVAMAHAGVDAPDEAPDRVVAAACDPAVVELCLFEGGILGRFLERRGHLLPADELELGRSWLDAGHRVWDIVEGVDALRDHGTGTQVEIDPASASMLPEHGSVLAVVTPGPRSLLGPVLPISQSAAAELTELVDVRDATQLATRIGREFGWTAAPDLTSARGRVPH